MNPITIKVSSTFHGVDTLVLYTTHEAAKQLKLSPSTLHRWRSVGGGPRFLRLGHSIRYSADDLQEFLENRKRLHTNQRGGQQ